MEEDDLDVPLTNAVDGDTGMHSRASLDAAQAADDLDFEFDIDDESEHALATDADGTSSALLPDDGFTHYYMYKGHRVVVGTRLVEHSRKLRLQVLCTGLELAIIGLVDQTLGSVMEHVLEDYQIDRVQVSMLYMLQTLGYFPASILNHSMLYKLGLRKLFVFGVACQFLLTIAFALKLPFWMLEVMAVVGGFGNGSADCCVNVFVGNLAHANQLLGLVHACYGIGCFVSPALSVYLISRGLQWNQFYLIIATLAMCTLILAFFTYNNETNWKFRFVSEMERKSSGDEGEETTLKENLTNKYVMFYALTLFVYIGAELSVGVWLFNYSLNIKHMDDKYSAFVTSTYWICMTAGRLILGILTGKYFEGQEVRAIVFFSFMVALFCTCFWAFSFTNALQAISIFCMGFFVGPMFGTSVVIAITTLPKRYSRSSVSLISGVGTMGAAMIPPAMGWVSEHFNGGHGQGLVYFPMMICLTFTSAFVLWATFYLRNRKDLDAGIQLGT